MTLDSQPAKPAAQRARAEAIREGRRLRTRMIRRRVAAGAATLFLATGTLITIELASGNDPALASHKASTVASSSGQQSGATTSGGSTTPSGSTASSGSGATSSVTTSQS